jgi:hypothetical protein
MGKIVDGVKKVISGCKFLDFISINGPLDNLTVIMLGVLGISTSIMLLINSIIK